jgi:hypothetical protein
MPDHLSIEFLGVLRGSADGPMAVAVLGLMALAALTGALQRRPLKRLRSSIRCNVQQKSRLPKGLTPTHGDVTQSTPGVGTDSTNPKSKRRGTRLRRNAKLDVRHALRHEEGRLLKRISKYENKGDPTYGRHASRK